MCTHTHARQLPLGARVHNMCGSQSVSRRRRRGRRGRRGRVVVGPITRSQLLRESARSTPAIGNACVRARAVMDVCK